jgi:hypothetical protein
MLETIVEESELREAFELAFAKQAEANSPSASAVCEQVRVCQSSKSPSVADALATETFPSSSGGVDANPSRSASDSSHRATATKSTTHTSRRSKVRTADIKYLPQAELDAEEERLRTLSQAAISGDKAALDHLRVALDQCPHIWRRLADLQYVIESKMIDLLAKRDPLLLEAFRKRCSELRQQVVCDSEMMVVKLAASRVIACWTFAQFLELSLLDGFDLTMTRQLQHAERRLEAAMRSFALVKRLEQQLAAPTK